MNFVSLPSFYLSAPTSPSPISHTPKSPEFSSLMSSPWDPDEFEFDYRLPARANSFSTMAFANELFCNGEVLPLKPPPRLQTSVPTSPRSFTSRVWTRKCTWNDEFDPFMIALEKVSEETSGRMSVHRRSRSYSPFRAHSISRGLNDTMNLGQEKPQETRLEPKVTAMIERKGSMYSKWVRSQTMVKKSTDLSIKRLWLGKSESSDSKESKMKKVTSALLRYASLKKETTETKQTQEIVTISKISYFKRLGLSFKTNRRKNESVEPKLGQFAIIKRKTKLPRCLGYAPASPMMKRKLDIS